MTNSKEPQMALLGSRATGSFYDLAIGVTGGRFSGLRSSRERAWVKVEP